MSMILSQLLWLGFLLFQTIVKKERIVTVVMLATIFCLFILSSDLYFEALLFVTVSGIGLLTERYLVHQGTQQISQASIISIPLWLPLVWGVGGGSGV